MLSETKSRKAGKQMLFIIILFIAGITLGQSKPKVTFIELGSVNCIPCKQMQPVMKAIEANYGEQVKVIFYDVWKKEHKDKSEKYGIKLIPTQIFQDENGKEIQARRLLPRSRY